jgi:Flp pilus assembly pilin Flp
MKSLLVNFWFDDNGAIISVEMILIIGVLLFGIIPGLVAMRNSVNAAFGTIGNVLTHLVPSFTFSGWAFISSPGGSTIAVIQGYEFDGTPVTALAAVQTVPVNAGNFSIPPAP